MSYPVARFPKAERRTTETQVLRLITPLTGLILQHQCYPVHSTTDEMSTIMPSTRIMKVHSVKMFLIVGVFVLFCGVVKHNAQNILDLKVCYPTHRKSCFYFHELEIFDFPTSQYQHRNVIECS